jgi:hypothetical protein
MNINEFIIKNPNNFIIKYNNKFYGFNTKSIKKNHLFTLNTNILYLNIGAFFNKNFLIEFKKFFSFLKKNKKIIEIGSIKTKCNEYIMNDCYYNVIKLVKSKLYEDINTFLIDKTFICDKNEINKEIKKLDKAFIETGTRTKDNVFYCSINNAKLKNVGDKVCIKNFIKCSKSKVKQNFKIILNVPYLQLSSNEKHILLPRNILVEVISKDNEYILLSKEKDPNQFKVSKECLIKTDVYNIESYNLSLVTDKKLSILSKKDLDGSPRDDEDVDLREKLFFKKAGSPASVSPATAEVLEIKGSNFLFNLTEEIQKLLSDFSKHTHLTTSIYQELLDELNETLIDETLKKLADFVSVSSNSKINKQIKKLLNDSIDKIKYPYTYTIYHSDNPILKKTYEQKKNEMPEFEINPEFKCPITKEIMIDPVIFFNGTHVNSYTYEKEALRTVFKKRNASLPINQRIEYLDDRFYITNHALKTAISHADFPNKNTGFICSITTEIMECPHLTVDGYSYEKTAINSWFNTGKYKSPLTNLPLITTQTFLNKSLQKAIEYETSRPGVFNNKITHKPTINPPYIKLNDEINEKYLYYFTYSKDSYNKIMKYGFSEANVTDQSDIFDGNLGKNTVMMSDTFPDKLVDLSRNPGHIYWIISKVIVGEASEFSKSETSGDKTIYIPKNSASIYSKDNLYVFKDMSKLYPEYGIIISFNTLTTGGLFPKSSIASPKKSSIASLKKSSIASPKKSSIASPKKSSIASPKKSSIVEVPISLKTTVFMN